MATIDNFPVLRPTYFADFVNSGRCDRRISTTRGTTATRWGAIGKLELVPAGVPRIDYHPATGRCLGMQIEEARTNLLTYTRGMSIANSAFQGGQVADSAGDPHFQFFTSGIRFNTPTVTTYYYKQYTFTTLAAMLSLFVVMDDLSEPMPGSLTDATKDFGLIVDGAAVTTGYTKEYLGGGRWRVACSAVDSAYSNGSIGVQTRPTGSGKAFTVYGMQLETGSFITSYIDTEAAARTRAGDTPVISSLAPWFSEAAGTIHMGFSHYNGIASDITILCIDNGLTDQSEQHVIRTSGLGTTIRYTPRTASATIADIGIANVPLGSDVNLAVSFGGNVFTGAINGGTAVELVRTVQPVGLSRVRFGQRGTDAAVRMTGHVKFLAFYPAKVSNAQLSRITA